LKSYAPPLPGGIAPPLIYDLEATASVPGAHGTGCGVTHLDFAAPSFSPAQHSRCGLLVSATEPLSRMIPECRNSTPHTATHSQRGRTRR